MTALQRLIPRPQLSEIDRIDVAAPAADVWEHLRHGELARSLPIRALFRLRTITNRSSGASPSIRIDRMQSTPEHPGFQLLIDEPPLEFAVGAIGKVWRLDIPFAHVADEQSFAVFSQPDFVKVAWAIRVLPRGAQKCHVELEVRVAATDEAAWRKFRRYFRVIGPFSRFMRRSLLHGVARAAAAAASTFASRAA